MHLRWRQQFIYKTLFKKRAEMARKPYMTDRAHAASVTGA